MIPTLAQDLGTPTTIIAAFIAVCLGLMGLVGWLLKHIFSNTLPNLTSTFDKALEKVTTIFDASLTRAVEGCEKETTGLRETFEKRQDALMEHSREWAGKEREASERRFQQAMSETRTVLAAVQEQQGILRSLAGSINRRTELADVVRTTEDAIWTKTLDGILTSWNAAAERLLGWRSAEVVGKSVYQFVPPDRHAEEQETLEKIRKGERVDRYQTVRVHRGGRLVSLDVTVSPILDPGGRIVGASSIAREA